MTITGERDEAVLSIGAMVGGTNVNARRWRAAIMALAQRVSSLREGVTSPLNVNVVYQVPGEVLPTLDFVGVRSGRYSRSRNLLLVQAAVPGEPPPDMDSVLLNLLDAAIVEAELLALKRKMITRPLEELRDLAGQLRFPQP